MSIAHKQRFPSKTLPCKKCGKPFKAYHSKIVRGRAKYCSKACADSELLFKKGQHASPDTEIKKGFPLPDRIYTGMVKSWGIDPNKRGLRNRRNAFSSKIPHNFRGWSVNEQGYRFIVVKNHPHKNKDNSVREHRLIIEKHIGRYLDKNEVVHHINEIRDDNRIENLMVFRNNVAHLRYHKGLPVADSDITFKGVMTDATK